METKEINKESGTVTLGSGVPLERLAIPHELLDLVRFMCATWVDIDKWSHKNITVDTIGSYPQIQGVRNQIDLTKIGAQQYDTKKIATAVKWMLEAI